MLQEDEVDHPINGRARGQREAVTHLKTVMGLSELPGASKAESHSNFVV
jgi:hypothetical protein